MVGGKICLRSPFVIFPAKRFSPDGHDGTALTCRARFAPGEIFQGGFEVQFDLKAGKN